MGSEKDKGLARMSYPYVDVLEGPGKARDCKLVAKRRKPRLFKSEADIVRPAL